MWVTFAFMSTGINAGYSEVIVKVIVLFYGNQVLHHASLTSSSIQEEYFSTSDSLDNMSFFLISLLHFAATR